MKIKRLPDLKKVNGMVLQQLTRDNTRAIYMLCTKEGNCRGYEIIKIRRIPVYVGQYLAIKGYTHKEAYPSNTQWGLYGFTYPTLEQALTKYDALL